MKICNKCGNVSNFSKNICSCGSNNFTDLQIEMNDWFKLPVPQRTEHIMQILDLNKEQYEIVKDMWDGTKRNIDNYDNSRAIQNTIQNQRHTPKCPTCGSTNIQKISVGKKVTGFAVVGVFSSNFGKTFECKDCGYKW